MDKVTTAVLYVLGLLLAGASSALLRKILFQLSGPGIGGVVYPFVKPWFTTTDGGLATSLCYVVYWLSKCCRRTGTKKQQQQHQQSQLKQGKIQQWQQQVQSQQGQQLPHSPFMQYASISPHNSGLSELKQPLLPQANGGMMFMDQRKGSAEVNAQTVQAIRVKKDSLDLQQYQQQQQMIVQALRSNSARTDIQRQNSLSKQLQHMTPSEHGVYRVAAPDGRFSDNMSSSTQHRYSYAAKEIIAKNYVPPNQAPYHNTMKFGKWAKGDYGRMTLRKFLLLIAPALLYQQALGIQGIGLRYVSASVSQMISGSCIIFTAIMAIVFLKRRLNWWHWMGIVLCMFGVGLVSLASFLSNSDQDNTGPQMEHWQAIYGIGMTLLSQVLQAAQLVTEEAMLKDLNLHPLQVVGMEGAISFCVMVVVVLPVVYFVPGPDPSCGCEENTVDTLLQLSNSHVLFWTNFVYLWSVFGTNLFGVLVTSVLGSVFRAVLLTARTALVWGADLAVFYIGVGDGTLGESWNSTSYIEAVGFVLLLVGTVLYAQGSSRIMQQSNTIAQKLTQKLDEEGRKRAGWESPVSVSAISVTQAIAMPVPPASPRMRSAELAMLLGSTPPEVVKSVLDDVLLDESLRNNWTVQFTQEVNKELTKQIASGRMSPSFVGTLRNKSSWLVHPQDIDKKAYIGASQYVNPFLPSLPIQSSQLAIVQRRSHSLDDNYKIEEHADEGQDDVIDDEVINAQVMQSLLSHTPDNDGMDAFSFHTGDGLFEPFVDESLEQQQLQQQHQQPNSPFSNTQQQQQQEQEGQQQQVPHSLLRDEILGGKSV